MNIVDIVIIVLILLFVLKGWSDGFLKETVSFLGSFAVLVVAYLLKNPVSIFLYKTLPFFKFSGPLSGISVLNIIVYELLAFLLVAGVLLAIYVIVLKITRILEKIVKITVIFALPSKILGAIVGFIEGVVVTFIVLFVFMQFAVPRKYIQTSQFGDQILSKTPILGNAVNPIYNSFKEIVQVADNYKNNTDRDEANLESLNILLKYEVISPENAESLVDSGKLSFIGAKELISKYKK